MKIIGISGSLRAKSTNTALLRIAQQLLPEGVDLEIVDISEFPLFNQDVEAVGVPAPVESVAQKIVAADAVLFASPEYNHSYTGVLKNAIDWLSRAPYRSLNRKPVAIVGASTGQVGSARGQMLLRLLLHTLNTNLLAGPEVLVGNSKAKISDEGELIDEPTREFYTKMLETFVQHIQQSTKN